MVDITSVVTGHKNLFRDTICIRATQNDDGWRVRCNFTDQEWGETRGSELESDQDGSLLLPIKSRKGLKGRLRLKLGSAE